MWSASAGYNTQTGVYGTCSGLDAWGTDVPYLQSVESPYERQYHEKMRRIIGKDYTYQEYNDSKTGEPYVSADTTHKDLGGFVQYNTFVSNGRSYRNISQFVSSRYCFDFGADANGTPVMTYYGYGHGVGMSQCGAVGFAAEQGMGYREILQHYYTGVSMKSGQWFQQRRLLWLAAEAVPLTRTALHWKPKGIAENRFSNAAEFGILYNCNIKWELEKSECSWTRKRN